MAIITNSQVKYECDKLHIVVSFTKYFSHLLRCLYSFLLEWDENNRIEKKIESEVLWLNRKIVDLNWKNINDLINII